LRGDADPLTVRRAEERVAGERDLGDLFQSGRRGSLPDLEDRQPMIILAVLSRIVGLAEEVLAARRKAEVVEVAAEVLPRLQELAADEVAQSKRALEFVVLEDLVVSTEGKSIRQCHRSPLGRDGQGVSLAGV